MPATLNLQIAHTPGVGTKELDDVRAEINAAFTAWTSRFDYTAGAYAINVQFGPLYGVFPSLVAESQDAYAQVGAANGTAVLAPLFGLNVAGRNGTNTTTPALTFLINQTGNADATYVNLLREFGHALGVQSFRVNGTITAQPGSRTVYDVSLASDASFAGPNAQAVLGRPVPLWTVAANFVLPRAGEVIATVNLPHGVSGQASTIQPLDVAMLRDAGLPVLTDQEVVEHKIARLYFATYGRVATGTELSGATRYYNAALSAGTPPAAILATIGAALVSDPALASNLAALPAADFVRTVFQNTYGRAVDDQTLSAVTQYLAGAGTSGRGAVLYALTDTDEARGRLSANANVTYAGTVEAQTARLYDTAFGRAADPGGFAQYTRALINGFTLKQAAASFLQSGEFTTRYGASPSDQTLVDGLYQNTLGRAPDAAGEAQYLRALASGGFDRADLVVAFSESSEHISLMAQRVGATNTAGLFVNTQTPLGLIPVLSGTTPFPGAVSG